MMPKLNLFLALLCLVSNSAAFLPSSPGLSTVPKKTIRLHESAAKDAPVLSEPEQKVYNFLEALHDSEFDFRIVVVGNGAILETTSPLGPTMKLGQSPATGENLLTFASPDQSFEFHLKTSKVSKVALVEKDSPVTGKVMRVMRFVDDEGKMLCSLILTDDSEPAAEWYKSLMEKYGQELTV